MQPFFLRICTKKLQTPVGTLAVFPMFKLMFIFCSVYFVLPFCPHGWPHVSTAFSSPPTSCPSLLSVLPSLLVFDVAFVVPGGVCAVLPSGAGARDRIL